MEAGSGDAARLGEVKSWLSSLSEQSGRQLPDFNLTPRAINYLYSLAFLSQSRSRSASIVASDLRQKASDYRSESARLRELLAAAGLGREHLSPAAVASAQAVAGVANLLGIRDTETSSFIVANADLSLRKAEMEEKRAKVQKESKKLLEYTRKTIAKLTELKRMLSNFEDKAAVHSEQMKQWEKNLGILDQKEQQYMIQIANFKKMLNSAGYTPEINHGVLMEMAEHKKDLEIQTKPLLDTLKNYDDLPPDKTLAALAIEDKMRQLAAANQYLEDIIHSALTTPQ